MSDATPKVEHVYQNHHLDSTRWDVYAPREDDIIVTTSYKAGTTWTQQILLWLMHGDQNPLPDLHTISPWVDARFMGIAKSDLGAMIDAIPGRRFLKSHLPLDGLPYYPQVKYLIVARDPRDVFMSFYNHYSNYTDIAYMAFSAPDVVGDDLPRCPDDPRALFRDWISRGWFDWESEGWPMWSNLHHTQSYWRYRDLPNFLFLHYADMLEDLEGAVRQIATFADIPHDDESVKRTVEQTTFANVKKKADAVPEDEDGMRMFFAEGQKGFFFKGSNGRWRDVLKEEELLLYEQAKERVLTPDCATWLEQGGPLPR